MATKRTPKKAAPATPAVSPVEEPKTTKAPPKPRPPVVEPPAPETVTHDQSRLSISLPPSRAVLILGQDNSGKLYHEFAGAHMQILDAAGLLAYGKQIIDALWKRSFTKPEQ